MAHKRQFKKNSWIRILKIAGGFEWVFQEVSAALVTVMKEQLPIQPAREPSVNGHIWDTHV